MSNKTKAARIVVGMNACVDVDGRGTYVYGKVVDVDGKNGKVAIEPADGSAEIVVPRSEVYKATPAEVEAFADMAESDEAGDDEGTEASEATDDAEASDEGDEGDDAAERTGLAAAVPKYRGGYTKAKLPSGRQTLHNNDSVALQLHGLELADVQAAAEKEMGLDPGHFARKYGHLNKGHQRMTIGNALRAFRKKEAAEAALRAVEAEQAKAAKAKEKAEKEAAKAARAEAKAAKAK